MTVQLPQPLINGSVSSRDVEDLLRPRKSDYEHLFHPGQEVLGHYFLPPFQRPPVWTDDQSRKLVESLFLGISIGSIVVSCGGDVQKDGLFPFTSDWLIDGQQRMRALVRYVSNDLAVFVGTPHEHRFEDLDVVQKRRFGMKQVGYIKLDTMDEQSLREMYDRLNFGGTPHTNEQRAVT